MKNFDIASFAENLIKEDIKNPPSPIIPGVKATGPDLSKLPPVSESEVNEIFKKGFGLKQKDIIVETKTIVKQVTEDQKTPEYFTKKLLSLIKEAQVLLKEMTDCGAIGMNTASVTVTPKKKKNKKYNHLRGLLKK